MLDVDASFYGGKLNKQQQQKSNEKGIQNVKIKVWGRKISAARTKFINKCLNSRNVAAM